MRGLTMRRILPARRLSASRRGAAAVEMAIILPLLAMMILGLMEYGWVFLKVSQVNMAARQGVRVAVRPDATEADVDAAVENMMATAGMSKVKTQYTLTYSYAPAEGEPTPGIAAAVAEPVTVEITVNYNKVSLLGPSLVPRPSELHGRGTMAKEGPPATTP
jgi:Flp pilus assembly protein TadG